MIGIPSTWVWVLALISSVPVLVGVAQRIRSKHGDAAIATGYVWGLMVHCIYEVYVARAEWNLANTLYRGYPVRDLTLPWLSLRPSLGGLLVSLLAMLGARQLAIATSPKIPPRFLWAYSVILVGVAVACVTFLARPWTFARVLLE